MIDDVRPQTSASLDLFGRPGGVRGAGAVPAPRPGSEPIRGQQPAAPLLLKPVHVAELLGISRSKVFALLSTGELPVVRLGRVVRVPRSELEDWVQARTAPSRGGLLGRILDSGR